jgi:hypothetical protein
MQNRKKTGTGLNIFKNRVLQYIKRVLNSSSEVGLQRDYKILNIAINSRKLKKHK